MAIGDPDLGSAENLEVVERRGKALELRKQGKSYRAIGTDLGVSHGTAFGDVKAELERLIVENQGTAAEVLRLELERLDALYEKTWAKLDNAIMSYPATAGVLLKCMERRAKLLGLDAPTRNELTGPAGGPMHLEVSPREEMQQCAQQIYDAHIARGKTHEEARESMLLFGIDEQDIPSAQCVALARIPEAQPVPEMPADFEIEKLFGGDE